MASVASQVTEELFPCKFQCGGPYRKEQMTRSNARAAWICKDCANAERCMNSLANRKENAELKASVARLKEDHPMKWASMVRTLSRQVAGGQRSTASRDLLKTAMTNITQFLAVKTIGSVPWHTRWGYADHQKTHYGWTAEDSYKSFDTHVANNGPSMQLPGDELRIPCMGVPRTEVEQGRSLASEVSWKGTLTTEQDVQEAMNSQASVGNAGQLNQNIFGDLATMFRPGQLAGVGPHAGLPLALPAANQAGGMPASAKALLPPDAYMPGVNPDGPEPMPLQDQPGQRGQRGGKKKHKSLAGVIGPLMDMRQNGIDICYRVQQSYGRGTVNTAKKVTKTFKGKQMPADIKDLVEKYEASVARCAQTEDEIQTWDLAGGQAKLTALENEEASLARCSVALTTALEDWTNQKKADNAATLKASREEAGKRSRDTKVFRMKGAPQVLVAYLYEKNALVDKNAPALPKKVLGRKASVASAEEDDRFVNKPEPRLVSNMPVQYWEDMTWYQTNPKHFRLEGKVGKYHPVKDAASLARVFRQLYHSISEGQMEKVASELEVLLTKMSELNVEKYPH